MRVNPSKTLSGAILTAWRYRPGHSLLAILFIAYVLRLLLIANGGQFFFPDEHRYRRRAVAIAGDLFDGDLKQAVKYAILYRKHHGMASAMLAPALFHRLLFEVSPGNEWTWKDYWNDPQGDFRASALIFAIPSVLCIALVYLIALQAGADRIEALLGAVFLAASAAMFIYAKHFLPYDFSMLFSMLALYAALRFRDSRLLGGGLVGLLLFCSFWIYYGQIFLVITLAMLYCVVLARRWQDIFLRAASLALGGLLPLIPILGVNYFILDRDVIGMFIGFSGTIFSGSFAEGVIFPFLYFAAAEGAVALMWAAGLVLALVQLRRQPALAKSRLRIYFAALLFMYFLMGLLSTGLEVFVLYGRTARALVPFVALICGCAFASWFRARDFRGFVPFLVVLCLLALANFAPAINQQYYREIIAQVTQEYGSVSYAGDLYPPWPEKGEFTFPEDAEARYTLVNAGYFRDRIEISSRAAPVGAVLFETPHPLMYRPWQFEGQKPEMRELINRDGLYIQLIDGQAAEG